MQSVLAIVAALVLSFDVLATDDDHEHHHHSNDAPAVGDAPLILTINPEARIIVKRRGALPSPAPCGTPTEVAVKIVNQALITAHLKAELVGNVPSGVVLEFAAEPLNAVLEETRRLRITLDNVAPVDLTIVFRAENQIPNFGGLDRVHFLLRCREILERN